jgi:hypothetical protein
LRIALLVCIVVSLGVIATLLSGLYRQDFSEPGMTNIRYGFPLGWHGEKGPFDSNNSSIWYSWENFTFDLISWSFLFGIVALLTKRRK